MITIPQIDPIALSIGSVKIHWYGMMYLLGFAIAFVLGMYRAKKGNSWNFDLVSDVIVYCALGVVIGGRIGYFLFWNWSELLHDPLSIFKIWQGGMAFHGGVLGVLVAIWLFSRKSGKSFGEISDFIAPLIPLGLAAGRIGNLINGEIWGRVTNVPWAVIYKQVDMQPRHPSQIYEFFLEGILLFAILWIYTQKKRPQLAATGLFLCGYGVFRFYAEFYREMDTITDPVAFGWMTMGQLLSIPMIVAGVGLMVYAYRRSARVES